MRNSQIYGCFLVGCFEDEDRFPSTLGNFWSRIHGDFLWASGDTFYLPMAASDVLVLPSHRKEGAYCHSGGAGRGIPVVGSSATGM